MWSILNCIYIVKKAAWLDHITNPGGASVFFFGRPPTGAVCGWERRQRQANWLSWQHVKQRSGPDEDSSPFIRRLTCRSSRSALKISLPRESFPWTVFWGVNHRLPECWITAARVVWIRDGTAAAGQEAPGHCSWVDRGHVTLTQLQEEVAQTFISID